MSKTGIKALKADIISKDGLIVSTDTLKIDDILTSVYTLLESYDIRKNGLRKAIKACFDGIPNNHNYFYSQCSMKAEREEDAQYLFNETIYNFFNDICPKNFYFGNTEGDGALFGFFRYEEEE